MKSLSPKARKDLELFFYDLFANKELGYSLFGDKPMSFCFPSAYPPHFSQQSLRFRIYIDGTKPLFRGYEVWKKINSSGKPKNYSLIIVEEKNYPTFALLINKKSFKKNLNKNLNLFKRYSNSEITFKSILSDLEMRRDNYDDLFENSFLHDDLLLGIMLGFGRHSSELFDRRCYLSSDEVEPPFIQHQKSPSKGFVSTEEELNYITERLQIESRNFEWYTNTFPLFLRVTTVAFAFDPDDLEAQSLIRKYKALHAQLTDLFDRQDWLEIILDKLLEM